MSKGDAFWFRQNIGEKNQLSPSPSLSISPLPLSLFPSNTHTHFLPHTPSLSLSHFFSFCLYFFSLFPKSLRSWRKIRLKLLISDVVSPSIKPFKVINPHIYTRYTQHHNGWQSDIDVVEKATDADFLPGEGKIFQGDNKTHTICL